MQRRREGALANEAARDAVHSRLRPVLMNALTDIIGFFPTAVAVTAGAEVQPPLATVVIGVLVTSMLLTPFALLAVHPWFQDEAEVLPE